MVTRFLSIVFAVCVSGLLSSVAAQEIRLVTGDDFAPYVSTEMPLGGMDTEIVLTVFSHLDRKTSLEHKPWKRGYEETLAGLYDATFPYAFSEARAAEYLYSEPFKVIRILVFVPADSGLQADAMADLAGRSTCRPVGYVIPDQVQKMIDGGRLDLQVASSMIACFRRLLGGRVDFVTANEYEGFNIAETIREKAGGDAETLSVKTLPVTVSSLGSHLIIPKSHADGPALIADFNRALAELEGNGTVRNIINRQMAHHLGRQDLTE